mmetsp:Transcript_122447/g.357496  ORF Transcript_122447/g.357496 Transcript_122447/m.357496 type:complete len:282 (-) Transcript_122447:10-855(-)
MHLLDLEAVPQQATTDKELRKGILAGQLLDCCSDARVVLLVRAIYRLERHPQLIENFNGTGRQVVVGNLQRPVEEQHDRKVAQQALNQVKHGNGQLPARAGGHPQQTSGIVRGLDASPHFEAKRRPLILVLRQGLLHGHLHRVIAFNQLAIDLHDGVTDPPPHVEGVQVRKTTHRSPPADDGHTDLPVQRPLHLEGESLGLRRRGGRLLSRCASRCRCSAAPAAQGAPLPARAPELPGGCCLPAQRQRRGGRQQQGWPPPEAMGWGHGLGPALLHGRPARS